jgi:hypothetical protein
MLPNSPAVAMVQTVFSANVYVNKVEMNQRRFNLLVDSIKRLDTSGTMLSAEEKLDMVVKALYNNPFRFFSATTQYFQAKTPHPVIGNWIFYYRGRASYY